MARSTALYRNKAQLQALLKELPARPGIYRFYDTTGALIYIGKSVCLRDRVRSYFTGQAPDKKVRRLRQEISNLDWEETGSELEALLLESRLVKRHHPRFNVMLKTFVPLSYVRVELEDSYPRLEVTRAPTRDGATYFGPFRSYQSLDAAVSALSDALGLRDCPPPGDRLRQQRPCYRHEFGTCSAPCLGLVQIDEYRHAVESACAALEGRQDGVLDLIRARMERAAERLQFEVAARLRDAIRHVKAVGGRQHALVSAIGDLSLVAVCPSRREGYLCLFVFRSGRLVLQEEIPSELLGRRTARQEWAVRLVVAGCAREEGKGSIDSALLDEIQIVTGWMKQKTREGEYWQFERDVPEPELARRLDLWLERIAGEQADRLAA